MGTAITSGAVSLLNTFSNTSSTNTDFFASTAKTAITAHPTDTIKITLLLSLTLLVLLTLLLLHTFTF